MSFQDTSNGRFSDILHEIFPCCLEEEKFMLNPERVSSRQTGAAKTAIVLSHVCSHWRSIVLSNPRLWSCISSNWTTDMIGLYLERSRHASLVMILCRWKKQRDSGYFSSSSGEGQVVDRWSLIRSSAYRWEHLIWILGSSRGFRGIDPAFVQPQGIMSRLHRLEILDGYSEELTKFMKASPNLRQVTWRAGTDFYNPSMWFTQQVQRKVWAQLKHVTFLSLSITNAIEVLTSFGKSLTHVRTALCLDSGEPLFDMGISRVSDSAIQATRQKLVHMPKSSSIQCLSITGSSPGNIPLTLLLNHLSMPNLHSLEISYIINDLGTSPYYPWPHQALLQMFTRSGCTLKNLKLWQQQTMYFDPGTATDVIQSIQEVESRDKQSSLVELLFHPSLASLETLTLYTPDNIVTDTAMDCLTPSLLLEDETNLPNLRRFLFTFGMQSNPPTLLLSPGKLHTMARSRLERARRQFQATGRRAVQDLTIALPIDKGSVEPFGDDWNTMIQLRDEYQDIGFFWHSSSELPISKFMV